MSAARSGGCDTVNVAWVWSVVLALALTVATMAARMLARATSRGASANAWTAPGSVAPVVFDVAPVEACDVTRRAPEVSTRAGDPALAMLAWLAALGWATFNGVRPRGWPWRDPRRAAVWAAMFTSAPEVLR